MSFFERAKAAATDLAAKADVEMKKAGISTPGAPAHGGRRVGGADRALRDLGVLAYLEATGRPASRPPTASPGARDAARARVLRAARARLHRQRRHTAAPGGPRPRRRRRRACHPAPAAARRHPPPPPPAGAPRRPRPHLPAPTRAARVDAPAPPPSWA